MGAANEDHVAVGGEALPLKRLIADLYACCRGFPVLVVGGGPSAPSDLEVVRALLPTAGIVSANGHATKLGLTPDWIFCKDDTHSETGERMEDLLRPIGVPIVGRHWWCDYRAPRWGVQGNSGAMAIALAALMGGQPIIPIGFDSYQGATYFHDPTSSNVSLGKFEGHWHARYQRLAARLTGAFIRPVSGLLTQSFPTFDPAESAPPFHIPTCFDMYRGMRTEVLRTTQAFAPTYDRRVTVPAGVQVATDPEEAALYRRLGYAA